MKHEVKKMKKAVGFIRNRSKVTDESRQRREIEAFCEANDLVIMDWIKWDDFGKVAYGNWMGHRRIDVVVAATNSDVTDSVFDFYAYKCKLGLRGSDLVVTSWKGYPAYGPYINVLEELTKTICRKEMEYEPVRSSTGRKRKAAKGGYIGGNAPMGYKVVDGRLEVNPEEVPIVKFIITEKRSGRTKLGTVEKLNAAGYRNRRGGKFTIGTVQGIWNNEEFYKGYYRIKDTGEWVKGQHEAIIK